MDQTFDPGDRAQAAALEAEMQRLRDQIGGLPADPLGVDPRRAALEEELQQARDAWLGLTDGHRVAGSPPPSPPELDEAPVGETYDEYMDRINRDQPADGDVPPTSEPPEPDEAPVGETEDEYVDRINRDQPADGDVPPTSEPPEPDEAPVGETEDEYVDRINRGDPVVDDAPPTQVPPAAPTPPRRSTRRDAVVSGMAAAAIVFGAGLVVAGEPFAETSTAGTTSVIDTPGPDGVIVATEPEGDAALVIDPCTGAVALLERAPGTPSVPEIDDATRDALAVALVPAPRRSLPPLPDAPATSPPDQPVEETPSTVLTPGTTSTTQPAPTTTTTEPTTTTFPEEDPPPEEDLPPEERLPLRKAGRRRWSCGSSPSPTSAPCRCRAPANPHRPTWRRPRSLWGSPAVSRTGADPGLVAAGLIVAGLGAAALATTRQPSANRDPEAER